MPRSRHSAFGAGENPMALLHQVASGKIEPPRLAGRSGVLLAMLDVDPERRPTMQQASEMLARLASGGGTATDGDRERPQSTRCSPSWGAGARRSSGGGSSSGRRASGRRGRGTDGGSRRAVAGAAGVLGSEGGPHRRAAERPARTRRNCSTTTTSGTDRDSGTCPAGCGSSSRATGPRGRAISSTRNAGAAEGAAVLAGARAPDPRRLGGPARRSSGRRGRAGARRPLAATRPHPRPSRPRSRRPRRRPARRPRPPRRPRRRPSHRHRARRPHRPRRPRPTGP